DLTPKEKLRKSYDIKATNIILLGLPVDIYTLVNHHKIAKDIWDRVKELMEGTELTKQERESKLYDDFDRYTQNGVEEKQDFLSDVLEEFDSAGDDLQVNTTSIFKADHVDAFDSDFDEAPYNPQPSEYHPYQPYQPYQPNIPSTQQQIIPLPPQQSYEPPVVQQQSPAPSTQLDLGFVVPSFLPTDDPIVSLNKAMMFLGTTISSRFLPTDNQLRTLSNLRTQATIQDGRVTVQSHIAKQCTPKKRVKDSEWFKENMLLAQAQEAGVILHEEQQDFLADGLEDLDSDCDDLQLHTASIFKANHVGAFDLDCDETPTIVQSSWQDFPIQVQSMEMMLMQLMI
ncbi:hypothetical protein Tco_1180023, partial [Tanacetum coccineum]